MDTAADPVPDLVLWRGDGCHLCDEARELVTLLLAERAATGMWIPALVERRIADDPAAERAFIEQIPVLEIDGRRLPLAVRAGPVRAFLAEVLDGRDDARPSDGHQSPEAADRAPLDGRGA